MEEINALFHGFSVALSPFNLMLMFIGVTLGVIIGVLPGLGGANGIAILLPLTFTMPPTSAIIMLSCIYWGALFGGAITSILFNIPGEPWSVATTFDGYPMAQQGRAGEALTDGVYVLVYRRVRGGGDDHLSRAADCESSRSSLVSPEFFSVYFLTFCSFHRHGQGLAVENAGGDDAGLSRSPAVGMDNMTGQQRLNFGFDANWCAAFDFPHRGDWTVRHR